MERRYEGGSSLSQVEAEIRAFLERAEHAQAATLLLRSYADELLGYLVNSLRDRELAREAFALFARDLWQGLPKVELETTARAWSYALARNAARRLLDRAVRKRRQELPLSQIDEQALAAESRAPTPPYLRTANKARVTLLRERLSSEERELLTLRVDRGFDWREIAVALRTDEQSIDAAAARYRKRFQLIKRKLGKWLREEITPAP